MKSRILIISLILFVLPILAGCGGAASPVPDKTLAAAEALVSTVKGRIVPARYVRLSFAIGGVIAAIPVKEGRQVHVGDTLAQLETQDLEMQVRIAEDARDLAQAEATLAMRKSGPTPEEIAVAQARVRQAQTLLDQAKANLGKGKLVSPIDGVITGLTLHAGEAVQPGTLVTAVVDLAELQVETTELDQFAVNRVWVGEAVRIIPDAFPDLIMQGHVAYIVSPLPSSPNDTLANVVRVAFDTQPASVRYGMTVRLDFLGN